MAKIRTAKASIAQTFRQSDSITAITTPAAAVVFEERPVYD